MHPFQKHREQKASHARVKTILKADGGSTGKDQSRYGDDPTALITVGPDAKPNQFEAHYLLGPPRTKNTPGFDTDTSSTRRKKG